MLNTTSGNARNQIEMAYLQVSDELVRALSSELVLEAIIPRCGYAFDKNFVFFELSAR